MNGACRILICGLNGAGKSTLGRALADAAGCVFRDIEDYYFPHINNGNPFAVVRPQEEVTALLLQDLRQHPNMILAAVRPRYSPEITSLLTAAIYVVVPRDIRLQRIRDRSARRFGDRILPGGDMHDQEEAFFASAAARPESYVSDWLSSTELPVIEVDGTLPTEQLVQNLLNII